MIYLSENEQKTQKKKKKQLIVLETEKVESELPELVEVLEELEVFARREGDLGKMSLGAFSDVNPFSVSNTREYGPTAGAYLSYVKVFVDGFRQFDQELHSVQMLEPTYLACVIELVRRSFDPYFVVVGPITDDDIRKIAVLLVYHYGLKMSADKSMAATA